MRNRIINGAMVIDQRNAGASVTPTDATYTLDRWKAYLSQTSKYTVQQNAGSVTPPVGFINYLGVTSSSAYSVGAAERFAIVQQIEGLNTYDLGWGTANAKTVTLSFQVYSSLTGTFGGSILNSAFNRSYPFTYAVSTANTWTTINITIAGDTTGTWLKTNGVGVQVWFGLGVGSTSSGTAGTWSANAYLSATGATSVVGTNGATFYITGVQLEVGTQATSFEYRQYQQELALCQRYYFKLNSGNGSGAFSLGAYTNTTTAGAAIGKFSTTMRTNPSALEQSGTASDYQVQFGGTNTTCSAVPTFSASTTNDTWRAIFTVASGLTVGHGGLFFANGANAYLAWSAEL
jgi:hypothetical protein